jgi:uncharacterized membrane protein YphA (DoxX/SURF4 family)
VAALTRELASSQLESKLEERAAVEGSGNGAADASQWSLAQRLGFRFGVIYFVVYSLFNGNVGTLPLALVAPHGRVAAWYSTSSNHVAATMGHLLGLHGEIRAFDNGDGVGDHVLLFCFALTATLGTLVWSIVDRDRPHYRRGMAHLRVAVRYVLASSVFAYAIFKVFPAQFSVPGPSKILQPYGQSSPMGLLWTFMGASPGYQMFAGWTEAVGCALLMFRRTTPLGALVLIAVLTNVGVMDLCYDVPAKLCVLHMLLMAGFLLAPSAQRLVDALIHHRAVPAVDLGPAPTRRGVGVQLAIVAAVLYFQVGQVSRYYFEERDGALRPPLYGAYDVVEMRRSGETVPALLTDPTYWAHLAIDLRRATAITVDGTRVRFDVVYDPATGRAALKNDSSTLNAVRVDDGLLEIDGHIDNVPVWVKVRPTDAKNETLTRFPVRWFNEAPDIR